MKKAYLTLSMCMVLVLLIVSGCNGEKEASENENGDQGQEEKVIRIAYNLPAEHATGVYFETLAKEIDKRTKNTSIHLKPKTFPNGQLFTDAELPDALMTGGVEIGQLNVGFMAGKKAEPLRTVDLPFLFSSWKAEWAAEDGQYGELYGKALKKMDLKLLGWPMYGTIEIYGNFPIKVPEDLKGKKMRAFGQGASLMLEELGASPVSMSSQEIYQAMERGTIDGYTTGPSSVVDRSLNEVTKYGTNMTMMYIPFQGVANQAWWTSLPSDVQDAVLSSTRVAQKASRTAAKNNNEEYKKQLEEDGVDLYTPTPEEYQKWVEASSGRIEAYIEKNGEIGKQLMKAVEKANKKFPGN